MVNAEGLCLLIKIRVAGRKRMQLTAPNTSHMFNSMVIWTAIIRIKKWCPFPVCSGSFHPWFALWCCVAGGIWHQCSSLLHLLYTSEILWSWRSHSQVKFSHFWPLHKLLLGHCPLYPTHRVLRELQLLPLQLRIPDSINKVCTSHEEEGGTGHRSRQINERRSPIPPLPPHREIGRETEEHSYILLSSQMLTAARIGLG